MYSRYILFPLMLLMTTGIFSQKYKKIHDKAVLVDTHNDFPSASIEKKVSLDADLLGKTHTDLGRLRSAVLMYRYSPFFADQSNNNLMHLLIVRSIQYMNGQTELLTDDNCKNTGGIKTSDQRQQVSNNAGC
jgi:hypothetical protein